MQHQRPEWTLRYGLEVVLAAVAVARVPAQGEGVVRKRY